MSVLVNTSSPVASPVFVGSDGETPTDADALPTCTVTRADGTALTAAVVTNVAGDGVYTAEITTDHTDQLDRLTLVWAGTAGGFDQEYTQQVDVAGGWYVTVPEMRDEPDLVSTKVEILRRERDRFEALAEDYCQRAFVPRYELETLNGGSSSVLLKWPHLREILSVSIDGDAQDPADFELDEAYGLRWTSGARFACPAAGPNVVVGYTHGLTTPPPDLKEACLAVIRSRVSMVVQGIPNPVMDVSDTTRQWAYASPSTEKPTGIDSVDEVLNRLSMRIPGVA